MIKYLGSKRRLVTELGSVLAAVDAQSALDLFTGTTR
ncbi:MAG TPA: DNA methyltransferase, partial [Propionibacteriaceae bacterium]|nr:DNA methyltransferase [Propionibacteriaceae bacterium]